MVGSRPPGTVRTETSPHHFQASSHAAAFRLPASGRIRLAALAAIALFLVLAGCSTKLSEADVERTVGRASYHDILTEVPRTLTDRGYSIYQSRTRQRGVYLETAWRTRAPFEDEEDRGVEEARTRVIVRARPSGGKLYTLRIEAQNQVRGIPGASDFGGLGWSTMPATEMYQAYVRELSMEIQMKVDAGMRTF